MTLRGGLRGAFTPYPYAVPLRGTLTRRSDATATAGAVYSFLTDATATVKWCHRSSWWCGVVVADTADDATAPATAPTATDAAAAAATAPYPAPAAATVLLLPLIVLLIMLLLPLMSPLLMLPPLLLPLIPSLLPLQQYTRH